jgi:hypothetical protein
LENNHFYFWRKKEEMPKIQVENRFFYVFFPPWAKREFSLTGALAQIFFIVAIVAIIAGMTSGYLNWKTAGVSAAYAILKNFV